MKNSQYFLNLARLNTIDQAEDLNHHSIVAMRQAETIFLDINASKMQRLVAENLFSIASVLCQNDYEFKFLTQTDRQNLLKTRSNLSLDLFYLKSSQVILKSSDMYIKGREINDRNRFDSFNVNYFDY